MLQGRWLWKPDKICKYVNSDDSCIYDKHAQAQNKGGHVVKNWDRGWFIHLRLNHTLTWFNFDYHWLCVWFGSCENWRLTQSRSSGVLSWIKSWISLMCDVLDIFFLNLVFFLKFRLLNVYFYVRWFFLSDNLLDLRGHETDHALNWKKYDHLSYKM